MGGRGSSSGISDKGKPYGSEFRMLLTDGNIKFVKPVDGASKVPLETMTKGRVYVTINKNDNIKAITYYDKDNKRAKQIDLDRAHSGVKPHTHHGYDHSEKDSAKGFAHLTPAEKKMVDRVKKIWYNYNSK